MLNYDYFCSRCMNYEFSLEQGVLCKLTHAKPEFLQECKDFILDPNREKREEHEKKRLENMEARSEEETFFAPEKKGIQKGVLGGTIMMAIAVVWFIAGYAAGYIFFYPPILFIIGIYAFIKGTLKGNLTGKTGKYNPYQRKEE